MHVARHNAHFMVGLRGLGRVRQLHCGCFCLPDAGTVARTSHSTGLPLVAEILSGSLDGHVKLLQDPESRCTAVLASKRDAQHALKEDSSCAFTTLPLGEGHADSVLLFNRKHVNTAELLTYWLVTVEVDSMHETTWARWLTNGSQGETGALPLCPTSSSKLDFPEVSIPGNVLSAPT